jgi:hypothetical protein
MAMNATPRRLPCGADLEQLVVQVADNEPAANPAHQGRCPYCQATLRRLRDAWEDVHTLATQPVPIPPALTAQIMARVRILAGHAADSILIGHPRGATRISHVVIGRVIQRVAFTVPGVIFASARPIAPEPPDPRRVSVAIRLVVAYGPAVEALVQTVRAIIDRRVPALTGAQLTHIDITIEDIATPTD